jgi:hypothetical protein|tara:strand:+ start:3012 stop:3488 length:477 start_codon:yes stop_codon:yes gene_type:complete
MIPQKEFERLFREEFATVAPNSIWKNSAGEYEVFGKYRISKEDVGYRVYCSLGNVGVFHSSKSALSWCIADKFHQYNTARELLQLDNNLYHLTIDIATRSALASNNKTADQHEIILTKLENKIIQKHQIEHRLAACVNQAKYYHQQGVASALQKAAKR